MTTRRDRLMLGLLAGYGATVVVAFLGGCAYAMMLGADQNGEMSSPPLGAIFGIGMVVAIMAALIAAAGACIFAFPLFWLLLRHRVSSAIAYLGAGGLVALATGVIFAVMHYRLDFLIDPDFRFGLLAIATCGPLIGVMFWLVAVRRETAL
jgi:hypothetical protein